LKTHITPEATENSDHRLRSENCSTERLPNKTVSAPFAKKSSQTTTTWFQTINGAKGWEEPGETTIQTIFKLHTGGAMEKRDPPEWND
jgi:hypothetical protein